MPRANLPMPSYPQLTASERKCCFALLVLGALVMVWPIVWLGPWESLEFYRGTATWLRVQWSLLLQGRLPELSFEFFISALFAGILTGTPCLLLGCLLHLLPRGRWLPPAAL